MLLKTRSSAVDCRLRVIRRRIPCHFVHVHGIAAVDSESAGISGVCIIKMVLTQRAIFPVTGLERGFDFIAFSFCFAKQQLQDSIMTKGYIFTYVFLEDTL